MEKKKLIICTNFRRLVTRFNSGNVTANDLQTGLIYMCCRRTHLEEPSEPILMNTSIVAYFILSAERNGTVRFWNCLIPRPYDDLFKLLNENGFRVTVSRESLQFSSISLDLALVLFGHAVDVMLVD